MEEIREMFKQLQADVNETKGSLKEMESNITKNINNNISELVGNLQIKIQELEANHESQERRLDSLERTQRQRNIILFGVKEEEHGYNDLACNILKILKEVMEVDCTKLEVEAARRIGRKGEKIRPVVLTFSTLGRKIDVMKKWKTLQNTNYSIAEDYPPKILEKRKTLYEQARIERENGNKVLLKYDKLIILLSNSAEQQNKNTRNNKRTLSQSPPSTNVNKETNENKRTAQIQKKNKISSYWTPAHQTNQSPTYQNSQAGLSDDKANKTNEKNMAGQKQKQ